MIHLSWIFAKELSTCLPTTHTHSELLSDLSTTLLTMYCLAYESRFRTWNFDRENELHYSFQSVISLHLDIFEELSYAANFELKGLLCCSNSSG